MKKLAVLVAGVLAAGAVYAADTTSTAVAAPAAPAIKFTYGGLIGVDFNANNVSVKDGTTTTAAIFTNDGDTKVKLRVKAEAAQFEAQVALNDDTYLKLKFNDALSLKYMVGDDVLKVGDDVSQTTGVVGTPSLSPLVSGTAQGLKLEGKVSDMVSFDVGLAPNIGNIDKPKAEKSQIGVKGGLTLNLGAITSITELTMASFAKNAGDYSALGFGQRVKYVAGPIEAKLELTYLTPKKDNTATNIFVKGTYTVAGDTKVYASITDKMTSNKDVEDVSALTITPGLETKAFGGVKFVGELPINLTTDDNKAAKTKVETTGLGLTGKMIYEFP